jgi:hypothetical protein
MGSSHKWNRISEEEKQQLLGWAREGKTYAQIADLLENKISRQRVQQICVKNKVSTMEFRNANKEVFNQEHNELMTQRWGERWADKEWRRSNLYAAMRLKFRTKKRASEYTKHGWELEFNDIVWPAVCPVFGTPLDYFTSKVSEDSVSFDRIDGEKGYVKGNVAVMSWRANRIKNNGTALEHQQLADYMNKVKSSDDIDVDVVKITSDAEAEAFSKEGYAKKERAATVRTREVLALAAAGFKKCTCCEKTLPVDAFYKSATTLTGLVGICIPCSKERKEKVKELKAFEKEAKAEEDFTRNQALGATVTETICNYLTD